MKLLTTPNPFLRHVAKEVKSVDQKTLSQIHDLITTLKATTDPKGVGLAATQVGLDKRIFVLITRRTPQVFINPLVLKSSDLMLSDVYKHTKDRWLEGCLSIPKIWGFVDRPYEVTLSYQTIDLKSGDTHLKTLKKKFTDVDSAYVQHETDHLNGVLFTDHILKQNGTILQETADGMEPISL